MLVFRALVQIVVFFFEILAPPFPAFALSFTLAGMITSPIYRMSSYMDKRQRKFWLCYA